MRRDVRIYETLSGAPFFKAGGTPAVRVAVVAVLAMYRGRLGCSVVAHQSHFVSAPESSIDPAIKYRE
jgi:hypothetical protein